MLRLGLHFRHISLNPLTWNELDIMIEYRVYLGSDGVTELSEGAERRENLTQSLQPNAWVEVGPMKSYIEQL